MRTSSGSLEYRVGDRPGRGGPCLVTQLKWHDDKDESLLNKEILNNKEGKEA